jgi:transposase
MSEQVVAVLGLDLGKNSVSLAGLDAAGSVVVRKRATRDGAIKFTAKLPSCVVAMEACCGAHFVARIMARQGHTIRLMSPEYVKPYVKARRPTIVMPKRSPRRQHDRRCGSSRRRPRPNSICKRSIECGNAW